MKFRVNANGSILNTYHTKRDAVLYSQTVSRRLRETVTVEQWKDCCWVVVATVCEF